MTSQKQDQGKVPLHLLDPVALEELARVLEFGAKKYSPNGWRKGVEWTRTLSALKRHVAEFEKGITHDPETGLNHMAHAMCNAMFLVNWETTHPEKDDRYESDLRVVHTTTQGCPLSSTRHHIITERGRWCLSAGMGGTIELDGQGNH